MKPARTLRNAGQGFTQLRRPYGDFVCLQCQCRAPKASVTTMGITAPHSQRNFSTSFNAAASTAPFAERVRKRIWGIKEPPVPESPHGDKSMLDNDEAKRDPERAKSLGSDYGTLQDDYIPSKSWDGLEHIGGATGWWEDAWDQENQFQGSVKKDNVTVSNLTGYRFSASMKIDSREELSAAIHQALVEIYTLSEARRPLADASNATLGAFEKLGAVSFSKSEDGILKVVFPDEAVREQILKATLPLPITQTDPIIEPPTDVKAGAAPDVGDGVVVETSAGEVMVEEEPLAESESLVLAEPSDSTWMDIPLTEPTMRFNVIHFPKHTYKQSLIFF